MMTLPAIQGFSLRSFGIIVGTISGMLITGLTWSFGVFGLVVLPAVVALVFILAGFLAPRMLRLPYRAWNRIAYEFGRSAGLFVVGICFYVVMMAVGRAGSSVRLMRPRTDESLWIPRNTLGVDSYQEQHSLNGGEAHAHWISSFTSWALRTNNIWSCCLLPFLILLSGLDTAREETLPTDIYTLY